MDLDAYFCIFLCLFGIFSYFQIGTELEEETLAVAQRERLEDIAKSERHAEAALELCRKDWRVHREFIDEVLCMNFRLCTTVA